MDWLTSGEALALLGTQPQTLYANVSRGRILARRDPGDSRRSLYSGEDVRRLAQKHAGRPRSEAVAADTIRWGDPILPSAISTVVDGRLYYRGRDAAVLAKSASLEETAAILWEIADPGNWPMAHAGTGTPVERLFAMLARRAATDLPTSGRAASLLKREAGGVFAAVLDALAGEGEGPAHRRLAGSWDRSHAADTLRTALVLLADHELNASTFAARVAASTGASLSASVLAGLSALTGPLHGGAAREVAAFLRAGEEQDAAIAVRNWLGQGRALPGFGHPLYPEGDIRATMLFEHFEVPRRVAVLCQAAEELSGEKPNIDFALAAFAATHDLPDGAPFQIFTLARSVGWLAHAIEQAESGHLIRPRARYLGPPVSPAL